MLIQNDNTYFKFYIKPLPNLDPISINWMLLARDFKKEGVLMIINEPVIKNRTETIWVDKLDEVQETITEIIELVTENDG